MAKAKLFKTSKNSLLTLSLVAALLLSVFVASDSFNFDFGTKAAKGKVVENGILVLPTVSSCTLGNYALIASSGKCSSVVASGVDSMLGDRVKVVGVLKEGILYAESVTSVVKSVSPTSTPVRTFTPRPIFVPTKAPSGYETPIPIDDPIY